MKRISVIAVFCLFSFFVLASNLEGISTDAIPVNRNGYVRINGSTSAEPMIKVIIMSILGVPFNWEKSFDGTRRIVPEEDYKIDQENEMLISNLYISGTHNAYTDLIVDNVDLIIVARAPSDDELVDAENNGVELEVVPIAYDGFVFINHVSNPVRYLALDEIQKIYTGQITDWGQICTLELPPMEIHPYQRNRNSGSQELMKNLVMGDLEMIDAPDMISFSMVGPINAITDDLLGIGYSVFFYAANIFPHDSIQMMGIYEVMPTRQTIHSREYPLTTEVYVVIRKDMTDDHPAVILRNWLLTEEGQKVISASGYVPISGDF
ncbi:MAG: PstS family phosphate ABC transporter substrate-binding protein [bacterium]